MFEIKVVIEAKGLEESLSLLASAIGYGKGATAPAEKKPKQTTTKVKEEETAPPAEEVKEAPVPAEEVKEAPVKDESIQPSKEYTRARLAAYQQKGLQKEMKELVKAHGGNRFLDLDESVYAQLVIDADRIAAEAGVSLDE